MTAPRPLQRNPLSLPLSLPTPFPSLVNPSPPSIHPSITSRPPAAQCRAVPCHAVHYITLQHSLGFVESNSAPKPGTHLFLFESTSLSEREKLPSVRHALDMHPGPCLAA
ncbi:hypothetical protein K504DRAFT_31072 [Pleomassaria siparia CBS 279.74]|uniref:Uncharacterized protein n=1 Tax=Pleomassaria siparia CBS 279.74 TaxID=1314801 RepID=A0A6G1KTK0_9PLEO|nr:hypothetical protein K504DRAFT_31072 [Pleomassaria siparia CBS 279.74]